MTAIAPARFAADPDDPGIAAYDALAVAYDSLTADYCYDRWLSELERLAERHGLDGYRVLDVACGTGNSFIPLLQKGYEVTGVDVSVGMLEIAARKAPSAHLVCADMRALGRIGSFDLITCLDDSLNYLLSWDDLLAALTSISANLAPHGVALWDLNTLYMFQTAFVADWLVERNGFFIAWKGETAPDMPPGGLADATVHVFSEREIGAWTRTVSHHRQRHWQLAEVHEAAAAAGLELLACHGQRRGAVIEDDLDEAIHTKAVFVAASTGGLTGGGDRHGDRRPVATARGGARLEPV
jgi:SAM-dependent methyltransferase